MMRAALSHLRIALLLPLLGACTPAPDPATAHDKNSPSSASPCPSAAVQAQPNPSQSAMNNTPSPDKSQRLKALSTELVQKHGEAHRARIEQGLAQVSALWRFGDNGDGDLEAFVREHFIADPALLDQTFQRFESVFEQLYGHTHDIERELRRAADLDVGPMLPVDPLFAALDPGAHLSEDLFRSQIAFVVLLNFPLSNLSKKSLDGPNWSRRRWAEDRLTGRFAYRLPAEVRQEIARASSNAELYIADYNIWMHHLLDEKGQRLFPPGLRLISHWNLRDELKAAYNDPKGLEKQRMIVQLMHRIVTQSIPQMVIDNPRVDWNPYSNEVKACPDKEVEANAPAKAKAGPISAAPEPDVRYQMLLSHFRAAKKADPYSPLTPTLILRSFELSRELSEERVRGLFSSVLTSPLVPKVAAEIEKKLGRKLEPQDLWYAGFKARAGKPEAELDAMTKKKYPSADAFEKDIPRILRDLGFSKDRAEHLAKHIVVDPSRGAGHALEAGHRGESAHLRTRIEKDGMNYKGYNIAIHELGHNVEQVFSLYDVDHTLLSGVPNSAFTEALAFVFQARDMELLGLQKPTAESERMRVLGDFWATWEIAGVSLLDIDVWHWMYDHPNATAAELRDATVKMAKDLWNKYYAKVLGGPDSTLLGIYSHMISIPLYLPDYPLGHLIAFQIEEQVKKGKSLGEEFERMAKYGALTPDLWMKHASGEPVSAEPLLRATAAALGK